MHNKKIGILTYHDAINFGAALQCFAFFEYLSKNFQDHSFEIINYKNNAFKKTNTIMGIFANKELTLKNKIKKALMIIATIRKRLKFKTFLKTVKKSKVYSCNTLGEINSRYNGFIIGSDQLWNYHINDSDNHYFLDVVKNKSLISTYATSIGLSNVTEAFKINCEKYVSDYNMISVREPDAKEIVKKATGRTVETVLDPVFLLDKRYWEKKCVHEQPVKDAYSLYYIFHKEYVQRADKILSNKQIHKKQKIYKLNGNVKVRDIINNNVKVLKSSGPSDFVRFISQADHVFTDSFHCVAFCIILHKDFTVFLDDKILKTNSRMRNLLNIAGLSNRVYDESTYGNIDKIDWKLVDANIEKMRNHSIAYIDRMLKGLLKNDQTKN